MKSYVTEQVGPSANASLLYLGEAQLEPRHRHRMVSFSTVIGYGLNDGSFFPAGTEDFLSFTASRQTLGPTQSHIQCAPTVLPPWGKWLGRGVTSRLHLRKRGAEPISIICFCISFIFLYSCQLCNWPLGC
jgi:hypothetical protein